jgi:hypothetical protein
MMSGIVPGRWLLTWISRPRAAIQLFCLPCAGGTAEAFVKWPEALGDDIELSAVTLMMLPTARETAGLIAADRSVSFSQKGATYGGDRRCKTAPQPNRYA